MTLKDNIAADIDAVFFNLDDFADTYNVDGREIPVAQDDDRILEKTDISALGTSLGEGLIFIKVADMTRPPTGGDQISINDKKWYVRNIVNNMGVYEIRIGREQLEW